MASVLNGVWVANLAKSRRHANHQFQRATLTIVVDGDRVSLHHAGVNMAGKEEAGTTLLQADGTEHELSQAPGMVVLARWDGTHGLETEARKDGRVVGKGSYVVSEDLKTLTATVGGTDAAGALFEQVIVFDRA